MEVMNGVQIQSSKQMFWETMCLNLLSIYYSQREFLFEEGGKERMKLWLKQILLKNNNGFCFDLLHFSPMSSKLSNISETKGKHREDLPTFIARICEQPGYQHCECCSLVPGHAAAGSLVTAPWGQWNLTHLTNNEKKTVNFCPNLLN